MPQTTGCDDPAKMALAHAISAGPALGPLARLGALTRDIKISHTVFALPFALLAAFLAAASGDRLPDAATLGLIVVCMVMARTAAMAVNRWADADLDALNPRTRNRAIPSGRLTKRFVLASACVSGVGFIAVTTGFLLLHNNPYPLALSPFVLAWLVGYSFAKRFTLLCHVWLGVALALSPLAAVVAVEPGYLSESGPWLLAAIVACWVAGFDVIYALQDAGVDRDTGVFSMPARLGSELSLWVSRVLHGLALTGLATLWQTSPMLNAGFAVGIAATGMLLAVEHVLVWRSGTHHIHLAFLTVNGVISLVLAAGGIVDTVRGIAS